MLLFFLPAFLLAATILGSSTFSTPSLIHIFEREDNGWGHLSASLEGSSYYKLPWTLEWLTGYIGYLHIHYFNAKIPFYRLRKAYLNTAEFKLSKTYGLKDSIILAKLFLYNEAIGRFITWEQYAQL